MHASPGLDGFRVVPQSHSHIELATLVDVLLAGHGAHLTLLDTTALNVPMGQAIDQIIWISDQSLIRTWT